MNAPGMAATAAGTLPWQHAAAAAAAGSQIPGLAIPPAAAAYAAALQTLHVSQLNQQHLAQAQVSLMHCHALLRFVMYES